MHYVLLKMYSVGSRGKTETQMQVISDATILPPVIKTQSKQWQTHSTLQALFVVCERRCGVCWWLNQYICDLHFMFDMITTVQLESRSKKKQRAKDSEQTCVSSHTQCKISAKNLFWGFARSWTVMRKRPGQSAPWMIIQSDLWHPPQCEEKHVLWFFISGCLTLVWLCYSMWPQGEIQQMFPFQWIW